MPTLHFVCPKTNNKVSTGVTTPTLTQSLEIMRRQSNMLACPECGEHHQLESGIAYFEDEQDGMPRHAGDGH